MTEAKFMTALNKCADMMVELHPADGSKPVIGTVRNVGFVLEIPKRKSPMKLKDPTHFSKVQIVNTKKVYEILEAGKTGPPDSKPEEQQPEEKPEAEQPKKKGKPKKSIKVETE